MYKKYKEEAYNIHVIKTNKFKKTVINISFRSKNDDSKLLRRRLLKTLLFEANKVYPTKRLLNIETEKLYDLDIYSDVLNSGNVLTSSFEMSILNEKYVKGLFEESIKFLANILFKPDIKNSKFDNKIYQKSIERIKEDIEVFYEGPISYAMDEVFKKIGGNTPLGYSYFGNIDYLNKIKNEDLYNEYLDMINNDTVDIFIVGNVPDDAVDIIKKYIKLKNKREKLNHFIEHDKFSNKLIEYKESKPYNQSTLIIGYKLSKLTSYEMQYVLPIYAHILGGGPDSKLFQNVREKNSLCYSIGCGYRIVSNILFITSGINSSDYKKALKLIKEQVKLMNEGKFTKEELAKAKLAYLNAYETLNDSAFSILQDRIRKEFLNADLALIRRKKMSHVTKKDIMKIIPKIHPEIVYLLEGSKQNEN